MWYEARRVGYDVDGVGSALAGLNQRRGEAGSAMVVAALVRRVVDGAVGCRVVRPGTEAVVFGTFCT